MRASLLPLLFLWACAAAHPIPSPLVDCKTPCGLHIITAGTECPAAKSTEARLLTALALDTLIDPVQACAAFDGWTVIAHGAATLKDQLMCDPGWWQGICVVGYTFDQFKLVEVSDEDWAHNALAHELIHVISLHLWQREGHCRWYEMGILNALKIVTGSWDYTRPEADCAEPPAAK